MKKLRIAIIVAFLILFIDQTLKIWIKTHMVLGEEFSVFGDWFYIHFTENNGMAFGLEFAGKFGKIMLSLLRIFAVIGIGWYIYVLCKKNVHIGLIISAACIWAGAFGNIIDSAFYGLIFNDSLLQVATLFPEEGGYSSILHGKVVDMLYFPIIEGHFPNWFPIWANESFTFFRPVFNIADSSISIGVVLIVIFQKKFFGSLKNSSVTSEIQQNS
jgi:signal peptidase II